MICQLHKYEYIILEQNIAITSGFFEPGLQKHITMKKDMVSSSVSLAMQKMRKTDPYRQHPSSSRSWP